MEIMIVVQKDERGKVIKKILETNDYKVHWVKNGRKALEYVKYQDINLIISETDLLSMSGYELLFEFKQNFDEHIPFVFLSEENNPKNFRRGMSLGADDFISEPLKEEEILSVISVQVEKYNRIKRKFERIKSNIFKYIPHELRTPLVPIIGYSDLLLSEFHSLSQEEVLTMIESISTGSRRLKSTVEKFILFSELEFIQNNFSMAVTGFTSGIYSCKEVIIAAANEKAGELKRLSDLNLNICDTNLSISKTLLEIVVKELIDNACKFSLAGTEIHVTGRNKNRKYELTISNKGKGFTLNEIKQIDTFVQFKRDIFQQSGNGLGLVIVKKILRLYGAGFNIESIPEALTEIKITLNKYTKLEAK